MENKSDSGQSANSSSDFVSPRAARYHALLLIFLQVRKLYK